MKAIRLYAQVFADVVMNPESGVKLADSLLGLEEFSKMIDESPLFLRVFDNPTLGDEDKQKVLKEFVLKTKVGPISERFLSLLVKRNRLGLLPAILSEIELIEIEKNGGLMGELVSATPLDSGTVSGITSALSKRLNKPVQLKQKVDPSLIAGMRVTVSGVTYDGSVKGKFDKLSSNL